MEDGGLIVLRLNNLAAAYPMLFDGVDIAFQVSKLGLEQLTLVFEGIDYDI